MRISKKTEYAVHSVLFIAHNSHRPILLDELAAQGISREYLAKVMRMLTKASVLNSSVGVNGGYVLGRDKDSITLRDIFEAVEGETFYQCEAKSRNCSFGGSCGITDIFCDAKQKFIDELGRHTVGSLLEKHGPMINWIQPES